jgi:hypothetical protein
MTEINSAHPFNPEGNCGIETPNGDGCSPPRPNSHARFRIYMAILRGGEMSSPSSASREWMNAVLPDRTRA